MSKDMLGPIPRALVRVPDEYHGTLLDAVNRLGASDTAKAATFARDLKQLLRRELVVHESTGLVGQFATAAGVVTPKNFRERSVPKWREENGVIRFSVGPTDGTTGEDWIDRLEILGFRLSDHAKQVLRSSDFKPTSGVTYEIAVLKGSLFTDNNRITKNIRVRASERKLTVPNAEVACLIRLKFTDEEIEAMGLTWIITMHEPINVSGGGLRLLGADWSDGGLWLRAYVGEPNYRLVRESGFAFAVSQEVPPHFYATRVGMM